MSLIPIAFEHCVPYDEDSPPCPMLEAVQELGLPVTTVAYLRQDVRTVDSPNKLPWLDSSRMSATRDELWFARGTNHCQVPAKQGNAGDRKVLEGEMWISRDMEEQSYCLVHVTPEQLLALLTALRRIAGKVQANSLRYSDPAILTITVGE